MIGWSREGEGGRLPPDASMMARAGYVTGYVAQSSTQPVFSQGVWDGTIKFDVFGIPISLGIGDIGGFPVAGTQSYPSQMPSIPQVRVLPNQPGVIGTSGGGTPIGGYEIPGGIYEQDKGETDWDEVYRQVLILNPDIFEQEIENNEETMPAQVGIAFPHQIPPGEEEMAFDWGDIFTTSLPGVIDAAATKFLGPEQPSFTPLPSSPAPAKVTLDTRTGKVTHCRRRRRRRLLTPTDLSDLAALQAIVGKGDALKLAVAKAVRR